MKYLILVFIVAILLALNSFAQQSSCDYKVEILTNDTEFKTEEFKWRMKATKIEGSSTNITGFAKIEDLNGRIVKSYKPWTNASISKQKTSNEYTPNLKEGGHKITAEIIVECDDTNKENNIDVRTIKIIIEEELKLTERSIYESSEISNNKSDLKFNETDNSKIGNKEIENVIYLKPINAQPIAAIVKEPEIIYKSSAEKAKDLILIFLLVLSVILNIVLIWRR